MTTPTSPFKANDVHITKLSVVTLKLIENRALHGMGTPGPELDLDRARISMHLV